VLDQSGKCPLLVFTRQMCDELNEFFNGEETKMLAVEDGNRQ
jgi:hypothetical protein